MARKDASLELRKARQSNGNLELNQAMVVRYVAVLQGTSLPPVLSCSPGLVLPAVVAGQVAAPALAVDAGLIYPAELISQTPTVAAEFDGTIVISCTMAVTTEEVTHRIEAGYDVNVFRGPSHAIASEWELAGTVSSGVTSDWQRPDTVQATPAADWQESAPVPASVVQVSEVMPKRYELASGLYEEGVPVGTAHGQPFDNLPPGHAAIRTLWVEAEPVDSWQVSGYRNPPRFDKVWQADQWQEGVKLGKATTGQQWGTVLPSTGAGRSAGRRPSSQTEASARIRNRRSSQSAPTSAPRCWRSDASAAMPRWSSSGMGKMPASLSRPGGFIW